MQFHIFMNITEKWDRKKWDLFRVLNITIFI